MGLDQVVLRKHKKWVRKSEQDLDQEMPGLPTRITPRRVEIFTSEWHWKGNMFGQKYYGCDFGRLSLRYLWDLREEVHIGNWEI